MSDDELERIIENAVGVEATRRHPMPTGPFAGFLGSERMVMTEEDKRPPSRRIADDLRAAIGAQTYLAGALLPSESELAERYKVAPSTVRQAMRLLVGARLVAADHGRGAFVRYIVRADLGDGAGLFVVFEGGEGAGKSTQVAAVRAVLRARDIPVTATREPGGTKLGTHLRTLVLAGGTGGDKLVPRAEALLYAADRAQHVDTVITPALDQGDVVLCDRYIDSTLAYQGAGRGLAGLEPLCRWAADGLTPDLTVLLDVPPEVGVDRAKERGDGNRFEDEELAFHTRVREAFLAQAAADPSRYLVLDARRPAEDLTVEIVQAIRAERRVSQRRK